MGNVIAGFSGRTVFIGHPVETSGFTQKMIDVNWFFQENNGDNEKKEFLRKNNVNYIYFSDEEKQMGSFTPGEKDYLKKIFENNETEIYQSKL